MTPSESIYEKIQERLYHLPYPCTLVLYGPSRTQRTTYRGEHSEMFGIATVKDSEEAWSMVERSGYVGWPGDLELYAIAQTVTEIKNLA